ncbi:hypothetical protein RhiirB3_450578 [Rhizophagus irregularis]|nr:hypothetical protein RhiirB3_450578 [Rhizophagus irregularis]
MTTMTRLLKNHDNSKQIKFVTLKNGSERLIVYNNGYNFLGPFLDSEPINVAIFSTDLSERTVITKSNRKFSFINNNIHIADGLDEDIFEQILKKLRRSVGDTIIDNPIELLRVNTSIVSTCSDIELKTNDSLYVYTKEVYVEKRSNINFNWLKFEEGGCVYVIFEYLLKPLYTLLHTLLQKFFTSIIEFHKDSNNFYQWWNFEAIVDFKWRNFGKKFYYGIWLFYTIYYLIFTLAILEILENNSIFFIISIILGCIHLSFEIRQYLWNPNNYLRDLWNLFAGAYALPVATSIYWLVARNSSIPLMTISIILLNFKFLMFFQVFESYGKYFATILGVAKEVFPFLVLVLFWIIIGFTLAFFVLLRPSNNKANDPMNLANTYYSMDPNGNISSTPTLIQLPDSNTNMYDWFPTSLLAVYLLLTVPHTSEIKHLF